MSTVFDLTPLTRTADSKRRWVVQGFDLPKRKIIIGLLALPPGLLVASLFWPLMQTWAILWVVLVEAVIFWFVEGTRQRGLRVKNYQAVLDRRGSQDGQVFVCGKPVDPTKTEIIFVCQSSRPVDKPKLEDTLEAAYNIETPKVQFTGDGWEDHV